MVSTASCVFCEIVAGTSPASFVYRDELVCAFMDIQPINQGHMLVIPNRHATDLAELPAATGGRIFEVAHSLSGALRRTQLPCDGINLFLADGEAAGQTVFHLHLHVVPRFADDGFGLRFGPEYGHQPLRPALDAAAAAIQSDTRLATANGGGCNGKSSNTDWFDDDSFWIDQYPLMFSDERFAEAATQVESLTALFPLSASEVLDVGCGPGRFAIPLAQRGYRVTGVDRTPFLIEKGMARAASAGVDVAWVQHDMRGFVRPLAFDVAISMMTSFGYFEDRSDDAKVLRNMYDSLRPGGRCIIDLKGKECVARTLAPTTADVLEDGSVLVKRSRVVDDWSRVCNQVLFIQGGRTKEFRFDSNLYSGQELRNCLKSVGFGEVKLYGDLLGADYGLNADRLVAVAVK